MQQKFHTLTIVIIAGISLSLIFLPSFQAHFENIEWAWGGFSFLFGTFAGYGMTVLRDRQLKLRNYFTKERSILKALYLTFQKGIDLEADDLERVKEKLDQYCVAVMSHSEKDFDTSRGEVLELFDLLKYTNSTFSYSVHSNLVDLWNTRERIRIWSKSKLPGYLRLTLYIFGMAGVFTLSMIKGPTVIENIVYMLYVLGIFIVLYVIEDILHLKTSEKESIFNTMERTFEVLDKPPFYREEAMRFVDVPHSYRRLSEGQVKVVESE